MELDGETTILELKQTGLTDRIIEYLGLDFVSTKGKWTPAEVTPLVKDKDVEPPIGYFS